MRVLLFLCLLASNSWASVESVSNGSLTLNLHFQEFGRFDKQRYIDAANQWLGIVKSVEGKAHHSIDVDLYVTSDINHDGEAGVLETEVVGGVEIPIHGEMVLHSRMHNSEFDYENAYTTVVHELGHVLGVGQTTEKYIQEVDALNGPAFCKENSKALAWYNKLYQGNYPCLPFAESGHLYDFVLADDPERDNDRQGREIPPMTNEVMANGLEIGIITTALLDDIGYVVEY